MLSTRPRRVTAPVALPPPPSPPPAYVKNLPPAVAELPKTQPVPAAVLAGVLSPATAAAPAAPAMAAENAPALPTFTNKYDKMKWEGGVEYGGRGGDPMKAAEWEHMTRGGAFDPSKPTGKDRAKEALLTGLYGALQGMAQTGDWRGAVGGGAAGALTGAISPETARAMTFEPQRQQLMQRQRDELGVQQDRAKVDNLLAGLEDTRVDIRAKTAGIGQKDALTKAELDEKAQKLRIDKEMNDARLGLVGAQTGREKAMTDKAVVEGGLAMAKTQQELKLKALEERRRATREPLELQKLNAQIAQTQANIRKIGNDIANSSATTQANVGLAEAKRAGQEARNMEVTPADVEQYAKKHFKGNKEAALDYLYEQGYRLRGDRNLDVYDLEELDR